MRFGAWIPPKSETATSHLDYDATSPHILHRSVATLHTCNTHHGVHHCSGTATTQKTAPCAAIAQGNEKQRDVYRSEEHTSELQSLMRISYAVFCLKKKTH